MVSPLGTAVTSRRDKTVAALGARRVTASHSQTTALPPGHRGYQLGAPALSRSWAVAAHRRRSWSRSWATGRTSVTLSTTTNAPSRRFAHRWSSAMEASAGPERCGVVIPGRWARPRPIAWRAGALRGPGRCRASGRVRRPTRRCRVRRGPGVHGRSTDRQLGVGVRDTGCIHARVPLAGRWTGDLNGVAPVCFGYAHQTPPYVGAVGVRAQQHDAGGLGERAELAPAQAVSNIVDGRCNLPKRRVSVAGRQHP